ncbi:MAG TPA: ABC transporter permease [Thermoanaerobaculia bacterium]|nr:ABC transporter permease [Thermoanaerobaculia bacterium]
MPAEKPPAVRPSSTGRISRRSAIGLARCARDAARSLRRRPGAPLAAAILLALGLASTATMLSIVETYVIRSLPFPDAGRLHWVHWESSEGERMPRGAEPAQWTTGETGVDAGTAWDLDAFTLIGGGDLGAEPEVVLGAWVDPSFFAVAGVPLALGRPFSDQDVERGDGSLAVISHELWQRRFGGRPDVLGTSFGAFMSDRPEEAEQFTVVGVLPEGFWWVSPYTQVLAPLAPSPAPRLVRLEAGASAERAAGAFERLSRAADVTLPPSFQVRLEPLQERYTRSLQPLLRALVLATLFVLLVACGNALLLVLVRTARRERELAVHAALAGGWGSAARLLIGEALLVSLGAGVAGMALTRLALALIAPHLEQQLGRTPPGGAESVAFGATALLGLAAATAAIALLFSLLPVWVLRRRNLASVLRGAAASATTGRGARRARAAVLSAEIAFTLALLAAGGLAVRSALDLERRELGHARAGILTGGVGLRLASYPSAAEQLGFAARLIDRLRELPGVDRAAIADGAVVGQMTAQVVHAEPRAGGSEPATAAGVRAVSPGYFATLDIPLIAGRDFGSEDRPDGARVAIVSADLAQELWPSEAGASAIGRRFRLGGRRDAPRPRPGEGTPPEDWRTVIGIAAPVRETVVGEELAELYVPFAQSPSRWMGIAVATGAEPESLIPALNAELRRLDPTLPLYRPASIERRLAEERAPSRFLAALLGGFSLFALALGTAGVYGVIAHAVAQRLREVAIRLSLGADRVRILRMFLAETAALLLAGLAAGGVIGGLLVSSLASRLHGVAASDASTWLGVGTLLVVSALLATWLPARRAVTEDPAGLLRAE